MKKLFMIALVSSLIVSSLASAKNLMIDEKSKIYNHTTALTEINNSITPVAITETETAKIAIRPFFHSYIMSGESLNNGLPYQKPKSMLEKANGYIFRARGKSFAIEALPLAGIELAVKNKKEDAPLVIDINNSAMQVCDFYGQPFYAGKFMGQGDFNQPNLLIPPKQTKTVKLFRSDAKFSSTTIMRGVWAGWMLPVTPVDFNKIHAELTLKIDDKYVSIVSDTKIPDAVQKKYDQAPQMEAK